MGYRNLAGPDGKKIIAPDPETGPLIARLFEWYAAGALSLREAARKVRDAGLVHRKSGAPVPVSTAHAVLRNQLYAGVFEWNGRPTWGHINHLSHRSYGSACRACSNGRQANKHRRAKHNFAFSGLIACGRCGCSIVGEIKKQRYIYYHCTGYKGRCDEPYVREEILERQFSDLLGRLSFDDEALEWVRGALRASHADEKREHQDAVEKLQTEHKRLQSRLDAMNIDKLDGRVDATFYERMSASWREEQARCVREVERHQGANKSYMDEGVRLLELARSAQRLFERREPREKR